MENENKNFIARLVLIKKYLDRVSGIIGALVIFIVIVNVLNYMYVSEAETGSARILWHYFYEDKGKIDNIYLGSSLVYSAINPLQLDEINGQYNFNLASSSQRLNGSYYLLKEADRNNSLSHVYLDLYYSCNAKISSNPYLDPIDTAHHWNWQNTDYMKFSFNKLEYMLSIAEPEKYIEIIFPFSRYRSNLDNWDYINEKIEEKNSDAYLSYVRRVEDDNGYSEYIRQGYYYSTKAIANKKMMLTKSKGMDEKPIGEISEKYLHKIIKYCQKRDIPITLFATPIDDFRLVNIGNYDNYINQIRGIAQEYGVDFYDFNLVKKEYLSINHIEYYRDYVHLNSAGAEVFTDFFAKVVSETASENEKYFYSSFAEKLQSEPLTIYGLYYKDSVIEKETEDIEAASIVEDTTNTSNEAEQIRTLWVASNRDRGDEYRIIMTPEEGEQYMVQEFAENKEFSVSSEEHGICTIVARMKDNPEEVQTLEVNY